MALRLALPPDVAHAAEPIKDAAPRQWLHKETRMSYELFHNARSNEWAADFLADAGDGHTERLGIDASGNVSFDVPTPLPSRAAALEAIEKHKQRGAGPITLSLWERQPLDD